MTSNVSIKVISDSIMSLIVDAAPGTKFGMSGIISSFDGKAPQADVCKAMEYLFGKNYIRWLGQHIFGLGTGKGLEIYNFENYSPNAFFPKPEGKLEQYKLMIMSHAAETDKKKKPRKKRTRVVKKAAEKVVEQQPVVVAPVFEPPVFVSPRVESPKSDVHVAIKDLEHKLTARTVEDLDLKCDVLTDLSRFLDPRIGQVLNSIKLDLQGVSI